MVESLVEAMVLAVVEGAGGQIGIKSISCVHDIQPVDLLQCDDRENDNGIWILRSCMACARLLILGQPSMLGAVAWT